jgi:hypothetical protein
MKRNLLIVLFLVVAILTLMGGVAMANPISFPDVQVGSWSYDAINYCVEQGYLKGYLDGYFRPYNATLVGHIHKSLADGITTDYWNIATRKQASDLIGVPLFGKADGTLGLSESVTRGQLATLLYARDKRLRIPTAGDTLVGYLDKTTSEALYLTKNASGAKLTVPVAELVRLYNEWAPIFGIRADFALAQAINETAHFEYGGLVKWTDNNFAGLGADGYNRPAKFATAELGVIAHLAHLACYAYPKDLDTIYCSKQYDPRHDHNVYHQINPLGGMTVWEQLNGVWAVPGTNYAENIARVASRF